MVIKTSFSPPTEGLHHVQEKTKAFVNDKYYGVGTLYIAYERLSWCDSSGQGFSLEYLSLPLHGICKDTTQFPHESIYCQMEEPSNGDENEGASDDSDVKVGEVRFVPEDKSALDVMFKALSECQLLQPDPQEQRTLMSSKIKRLEMENEELTKEAEEKLLEQMLRETKEIRVSTSGMSQGKEQGMESTLQKRDETEAKQRRVGRPSATDTTAEELQQEITRLKEENKKLKLEYEKTAAHEQQKHSNKVKELTDKLLDAEFSRVALENEVSELTAKVAEARLDSHQEELKRSCRILERENKKLLADQEKLKEGWRILKRQNEKLQADIDKVLQRKKNQ